MMSGCTGAERVRSRNDYKIFKHSFYDVLKGFPDFVDILPTGSYCTNHRKETFGDIDLVTFISNKTRTKKEIKQDLVVYFEGLSKDVIVEFTSEKYSGKRAHNSGEIVTVRYYEPTLGYSVQIDVNVALTPQEMVYKKWFLDLDAAKQGLISGLVKTIIFEEGWENIKALLLNYDDFKFNDINLGECQELEFSLSPVELQLRLVTYEDYYSYTNSTQIILYRTQSPKFVKDLLSCYNLNQSFEDLLEQVKRTLKKDYRSVNRIKGLFKSIVTIKEGEKNTPKASEKLYALSLIEALELQE